MRAHRRSRRRLPVPWNAAKSCRPISAAPRLAHRLEVERLRHVPGVAAQERRDERRVDDPVFVDLADRAEPRVEARRRLPRRRARGRRPAGPRSAPRCERRRRRCAAVQRDAGDLRQRVDAGVGRPAPCTVDRRRPRSAPARPRAAPGSRRPPPGAASRRSRCRRTASVSLRVRGTLGSDRYRSRHGPSCLASPFTATCLHRLRARLDDRHALRAERARVGLIGRHLQLHQRLERQAEPRRDRRRDR